MPTTGRFIPKQMPATLLRINVDPQNLFWGSTLMRGGQLRGCAETMLDQPLSGLVGKFNMGCDGLWSSPWCGFQENHKGRGYLESAETHLFASPTIIWTSKMQPRTMAVWERGRHVSPGYATCQFRARPHHWLCKNPAIRGYHCLDLSRCDHTGKRKDHQAEL